LWSNKTTAEMIRAARTYATACGAPPAGRDLGFHFTSLVHQPLIVGYFSVDIGWWCRCQGSGAGCMLHCDVRKTYNPGSLHYWLEDNLNKQYAMNRTSRKIAFLFSALSLVISCLGLFRNDASP